MKNRIIRILVFIVLSIAVSFRFPAVCCALDVTLSWNASSGATGYKIYYDTNYSSSGPPYNGIGALEGSSPIDAGSVTQFTLHDLPENGYRFSLTAYNAYGESGYSAQIVLPPPQYTLSVSSTGSGTVTPGNGNYSKDASVQLTATPSSGWVFSGWSGDLNSATNPATIVMDGNKSVTAVFMQLPELYSLKVSISGQGSVLPSGGNYSKDASVQLTATPSSGWVFSGWSGDVGGSANPAIITMASNRYVMAAFKQVSPLINVFSATPAAIGQGESAILVWDMSRGISASIDNGVGAVDPAHGSKEVLPLSTTTYMLTVTNAAGSDTKTATVKVGSKIVEVIPHDGAGIQDKLCIPNNTSFAIRIIDSEGIDINNPDSIKFSIYDGMSAYKRDLSDNTVTVTKLLDEDDSYVTEFWAAYHRAAEAELGNYPFKSVIHVEVDIHGNNDQMIQASYEFKTETERKHKRAKARSLKTCLLPPTDIKLIDMGYNASGLEVVRGRTKGASIIYDSSGPVLPIFASPRGLPPLRIKGIKGVGRSINLQPPTVFSTPATLFIPCRRYSDVSDLVVFLFNGIEWVPACDTNGNVLPDGDGWMVPGSRINHSGGKPSTIEIKVYHTSGARACVVR